MFTPIRFTALILLSVCATAAQAYGGGESSNHCDKPVFSDFQPAPNKYTQSFSEFSFIASANTTPTSIEVNISAGTAKYHFPAKELEITQQRSGRFEVKGKMERPLEHGFVRISASAHSKPSCTHTDGLLVRIH